ncbi:hypothetical protein NMG60_11027714 [Bertholletia excelsa]
MVCACKPCSPAQLAATPLPLPPSPPASTLLLPPRPKFRPSVVKSIFFPRCSWRRSPSSHCKSSQEPSFADTSPSLRSRNPFPPHSSIPPHFLVEHHACNNHYINNINNDDDHGSGRGGGGGDGGGGGWNHPFSHGGWWRNDGNYVLFLCSRVFAGNDGTISYPRKRSFLFIVSVLSSFGHFRLCSAQARTNSTADDENEEFEVVWEVKGGRWIKLVADHFMDAFVVSASKSSSSGGGDAERKFSSSIVTDLWIECRDLFVRLMLPDGFPHSVTSDYLEYSLWRGLQGVAAQISGVLATQSLLYAVGLGKGAIPTAAAVNWVLKDGIGYLSKILLSKYGRHFDVNPKGWRLFADLLENVAYGMEILTPAFPHLFVPIGAAAGAGRSAAALIQAATRSCFYAGFAAQRNFAEVIAKGEAQGMVSKSIGIMLGIALANQIRSSTPLALASFGLVTWIHMFCNLKSYQSIQLRTLNPYRASLVFSEYLLGGLIPSIKEVNDEEPLFPALPALNLNAACKAESTLSSEAKDAANNIEARLLLGSKFSDIVKDEDEALALFDLYREESYILTEHEGRFCVILKESSMPQDMLKSLFHVSYMYWLEKYAGIKASSIIDDCRPGGKLQISLEYVQREFNYARNDGELAGWTTDGLIARPLHNRIRPGCDSSVVES